MLLWGVSLDGILGALISLVIIKAGIEMLASPVNELLGTSISADFAKQIQKEVSDFQGVHGVFDLILHNYGFYYSEKNKYLSVDVVPDISVHDEAVFVSQLTTEIQPLVTEQQVVIVVLLQDSVGLYVAGEHDLRHIHRRGRRVAHGDVEHHQKTA
jgi:divalent metal cation (Fe/Co/Zn/Cd) transporter